MKIDQRKKELIKEMTRQGRCGSCGKYWDVPDVIDEELARQINIGLLRHPRVVEIIQIFIDNAKGKERQER
jgi:hypothetical protein